MRSDLSVETDHFQLLFGDAELGPAVDTTHLWDNVGGVVQLDDAPELAGIATARYGGRTKVQVEIQEKPPAPDPEWTYIGRLRLRIPSGRLVLWGPEALDLRDAPSVNLVPGVYEGRAFSRGVDGVTDEMAEEGPDEYRVALWRGH
jgi:hypothetical protein